MRASNVEGAKGLHYRSGFQKSTVREEQLKETKPFEISKEVVWEAYVKIRENKGSAGIDGVTLEEFGMDLKNNLYKIWNRMSSGSYFPLAVMEVEIPKEGGVRKLGIATVADRIAQMVVKIYLEPKVEPYFHVDSYGYRPNRSAIGAVGKAKERCWKYDFVLDLDIEKFFDTLDRNLLMHALRKHTDSKWIELYVERWLEAEVRTKKGEVILRNKGTAQGSVISPLLSNLYLHYTFDEWMKKKYPIFFFERYADDIIVHCKTEKQALDLLKAVGKRFAECGLKLNEGKTKIVYCKDDKRKGSFPTCSFDFLGYTFRVRSCKCRNNKIFNSFAPAVSNKASKKFRKKIMKTGLNKLTNISLGDIARKWNPIIRGWIEYFKHFYSSAMRSSLDYVNQLLVKWAKRKFAPLRNKYVQTWNWLALVSRMSPKLFAHWQIKILPSGSR